MTARRLASRLAVAALGASALLGCTSAAEAPSSAPVIRSAPSAPSAPSALPAPAPAPPVPTPSHAAAAVAAAAGAADGRADVTLGVAVLDRATGAVGTNDAGTHPLRTASVAKLLTVDDLLERRATGEIVLGPDTEDRIRRALTLSDDDAMNALWSLDGGSDGVRRVAARLGLTATAPPDDPSQWGETTMSARDATVLVASLAARPPVDRDLVLGALSAAPPVAADGFDQAFGLLDPATRGSAAAKQGWLCCLQSSVDLDSVGLPEVGGRYVVALMSNQPYGYDAARDLLDRAAADARAALAGA